MDLFSEHLAEVLSLKARIAAQKLRLDRMRAAPANTHPQIEIRKAELGLDCDRSRLRLMEQAFTRKYNFDPNQPRVPAGNDDGGQWTNTGGRSYALATPATSTPRQRVANATRSVAAATRPAISSAPNSGMGRAQSGLLAGAETLRQLLQSDPLILRSVEPRTKPVIATIGCWRRSHAMSFRRCTSHLMSSSCVQSPDRVRG